MLFFTPIPPPEVNQVVTPYENRELAENNFSPFAQQGKKTMQLFIETSMPRGFLAMPYKDKINFFGMNGKYLLKTTPIPEIFPDDYPDTIYSLLNLYAKNNTQITEGGDYAYYILRSKLDPLYIDKGSYQGKGSFLISDNSFIDDINNGSKISTGGPTFLIANKSRIHKFINRGEITSSSSVDNGAGLFISTDSKAGSVSNTGKIRGKYGIYNQGEISNNINNSGIIEGDIINTGTIKGDIVNTGIIRGNIVNSGKIIGDAVLASAHFNLTGKNGIIQGQITGNDSSALSFGDKSNPGNWSTTDKQISVGHINITSGSTLNVTRTNKMTATSQDANAVTNEGRLIIESGASLTSNMVNIRLLRMDNSSQLNGNLDNRGILSSGESSTLASITTNVTNTLTIKGNYIGTAGSSVSLSGRLTGNTFLHDKLVITGDTTGTSNLHINHGQINVAQMPEELQLINVGGKSEGIFTYSERIVAGMYDYKLQKGNAGGTEYKSWYLSSYSPQAASDPVSVEAMPGKTVRIRMVRPEAASYASNLQAAHALFTHSQDSGAHYTDKADGNANTPRLWMRHEGGRNTATMADSQLNTTASRYVIQLGSEVGIWQSHNGGQASVGIIGGHLKQNSLSRNSINNYRSYGSVSGYSTGLYGKWQQNQADISGLYADGWLQLGWFKNDVKGERLVSEQYQSRGLGLSTTLGYNWRLLSFLSTKGMDNSFWLQPQAQLLWTDIKAKDHLEHNGTHVSIASRNLQTKLSLGAFFQIKNEGNLSSARVLRPFVKASWIHNTEPMGVNMGSGSQHFAGTGHQAELEAGVEGQLTGNISIIAGISHKSGGREYSDTQGTLNAKYCF